MTRPRLTLSTAILSALLLLLMATWFLLGVASHGSSRQSLYSRKSDETRRLVTLLSRLLPEEIASSGSSPLVARFVETLEQDHEFRSLCITDRSGGVILAIPPAPAPDHLLAESLLNSQPRLIISPREETVTCYAPVAGVDGVSRGLLRLTLTLAEENRLLKNSGKSFLGYTLLSFLLFLGVGSLLLSRLIILPIRRVQTATDEELNQAREESIRTEKMASIGLLAAGMAHEVGAPLAAIMGYAGILRQELEGDPERAAYAQRIGDDARRIDHIVRHLLDYARPRQGELSRIDTGGIIREVMELLTAQGLFRTIRVTCDIPPDLPEVRVDGHQLQQVLINLIMNAHDAMPQGGELLITASEGTLSALSATPRLHPLVRGRRRSDFNGAFHSSFKNGAPPLPYLKIELRDTGEGIAPDQLDKIFDPFFTTKEPGKGTGLGLAICARIIDSFNGRITVQSTTGKGTIFSIWLPRESE